MWVGERATHLLPQNPMAGVLSQEVGDLCPKLPHYEGVWKYLPLPEKFPNPQAISLSGVKAPCWRQSPWRTQMNLDHCAERNAEFMERTPQQEPAWLYNLVGWVLSLKRKRKRERKKMLGSGSTYVFCIKQSLDKKLCPQHISHYLDLGFHNQSPMMMLQYQH